jgi:hypothetical protein
MEPMDVDPEARAMVRRYPAYPMRASRRSITAVEREEDEDEETPAAKFARFVATATAVARSLGLPVMVTTEAKEKKQLTTIASMSVDMLWEIARYLREKDRRNFIRALMGSKEMNAVASDVRRLFFPQEYVDVHDMPIRRIAITPCGTAALVQSALKKGIVDVYELDHATMGCKHHTMRIDGSSAEADLFFKNVRRMPDDERGIVLQAVYHLPESTPPSPPLGPHLVVMTYRYRLRAFLGAEFHTTPWHVVSEDRYDAEMEVFASPSGEIVVIPPDHHDEGRSPTFRIINNMNKKVLFTGSLETANMHIPFDVVWHQNQRSAEPSEFKAIFADENTVVCLWNARLQGERTRRKRQVTVYENFDSLFVVDIATRRVSHHRQLDRRNARLISATKDEAILYDFTLNQDIFIIYGFEESGLTSMRGAKNVRSATEERRPISSLACDANHEIVVFNAIRSDARPSWREKPMTAVALDRFEEPSFEPSYDFEYDQDDMVEAEAITVEVPFNYPFAVVDARHVVHLKRNINNTVSIVASKFDLG